MKWSEVDPKVGAHMILRLMGRQAPKAWKEPECATKILRESTSGVQGVKFEVVLGNTYSQHCNLFWASSIWKLRAGISIFINILVFSFCKNILLFFLPGYKESRLGWWRFGKEAPGFSLLLVMLWWLVFCVSLAEYPVIQPHPNLGDAVKIFWRGG